MNRKRKKRTCCRSFSGLAKSEGDITGGARNDEPLTKVEGDTFELGLDYIQKWAQIIIRW